MYVLLVESSMKGANYNDYFISNQDYNKPRVLDNLIIISFLHGSTSLTVEEHIKRQK